MKDIKTQAIVLKRTNYGEADRILQLITPEGKYSVLARSVRKERSKLAGSIELFSLSEITIHQGKGDLGILTSARLTEFYSAICTNLATMELAGACLRDISRRADQIDSPDFFDLLSQTLKALNLASQRTAAIRTQKTTPINTSQDSTPNPNNSPRKTTSNSSQKSPQIPLIRTWWLLNLARITGEDLNLHTDTQGVKLQPNQTYVWNSSDNALEPSLKGPITPDHIKLMRLILSAPLRLALQVQNVTPLTEDILYIARCLTQQA